MSEHTVLEAQLLRWSESHNGRTVTLQLPADGEHPFRGLPCGPANGQRLALAVVLINDDETTTPVEPPSTAPEKPKGGANGNGTGRYGLAAQAGACCNDARFRKFIKERINHFRRSDEPVTPDDAKQAIYDVCEITSRTELDRDDDAAARWRSLHSAYIAWREAP